MTNLLSVHGFTLHVFGRTIFDRFELEVRAGELVLLVGPNGSGKSTLLDVVAGVRPLPPRARVTVLGVDRGRDPRAVARRLGYAADRPEVPREVRVDEWLTLVAAVRGAERPPLDELPFDVAELRGQPLGALSLGETRRVHLAAARIGGAPLLLLDEPTNGLDAARRSELERTLRAHVAKGGGARAAVVATHDRRFIRALVEGGGARVVHLANPPSGTARSARP
jgi:ABC-2 type transport system ATP-binding protein